MTKGTLLLQRKENNFTAGFGLIKAELPDLEKQMFRLHPKEQKYYHSLKVNRRKLSYLLGRLAAKKAIAERSGEAISESCFIDFGIFQFPVVKQTAPNIQVSISHCDTIGLALAFSESHPLGIDIERVDAQKIAALKNQLCEKEFELIAANNMSQALGMTTIWSIKEGLSKIFRTGLTMDFRMLEIKLLERSGDLYISTFRHCIQYKAISYPIGDYVCSLVLPGKTEVNLDGFWSAIREVISP